MPDNFVQDPYSTMSYNRYGYALNNPLMFTDPSGEIIPLIIIGAAIIGAYVGGAQANGTYNPFKWNWGSGRTWTGIVGGAVIGAVSSYVAIAASIAIAPTLASYGISGGIAGGAITGVVSGSVGGAISGGFMSLLPGGGGDFWGGFTKGAWTGAWMGGLIGGVVGGLTAPKGGFWKGAAPRPTLSQVSTMETQGLSLTDDSMAIKAELMSAQNTTAPRAGPTTTSSTTGGAIQDGMGGNLNIKATRDPFDLVKIQTSNKGVNIGEYTLTKTVSNNLATRPYLNSPLTIQNIMSTGKGIPDAFYKGGMNWKVPGSFNGSNGIFELGINPETKVIYHFLFKSVN
jgi:hypothetical protein